MKSSTKGMKIFRIVITTILICLFILIVVPSLYMFIAKKTSGKLQPTIFGFASAIVVTGSMSDTIKVNDFIITKTQNDYFVGDIIMFESPSGRSLTTHRIIGKTESGFTTQGDFNNAPDENITPASKVVGKVVAILPQFGGFFYFLQSPWGIMTIFAVGILLIELTDIIEKLKSNRLHN